MVTGWDEDGSHCEEPLHGGNASGVVVKVGQTVRKPWLSTSSRTIEFVAALRERGIDFPGIHGRDGQGCLVIDYVPGTMALEITPLPDATIHRIGVLIREIHEASTALDVPADWPDGVLPAPRRELICHNDLAPGNLVVDGERLVFIDWDGAAPSSRLWDLAYAAIAFAHLFPDADVAASARRLAAFLDGYGADAELRRALPATLQQRSRAMYDLLRSSHDIGLQPWARMFTEGHGQHWWETIRFIAERLDVWAEAARAR